MDDFRLEEVEKLLAHYEYELLKEQGKENKDKEKITLINRFVNDLSLTIQKEKEKTLPKDKRGKKKQKVCSVSMEVIRNPIEPELVIPKKRRKEGY